MSDKHLHIVTHDVPWPADFGGVVDQFYKIKALHTIGVKIHLHCFVNKRPQQEELNKYCEKVYYYQRKNNVSRFSFRLPFIVSSRKNEDLITNLQQDNHPILFEGIHTTYPLYAGKLNNRKVLVRLFNAEFEYYNTLSSHEKNFLKKLYFINESRLLKKYEGAISKKAIILPLSKQDVDIYKQHFNTTNIQFLPVFLPYTMAAGKEGKGCFCLYHGNLSINENEKAVTWLLNEVFNEIDMPLIIAGKNPSQKLQSLAKTHCKNCSCVVADPSEKELQDLIAKAHVHILPSFNNTGVKLKLLNAVFNGKHCLVNKAGVAGSELENCCHIAETASEFRNAIHQLYQQPFCEEEREKRQGYLQTIYNNEANARQLMTWIY